MKTEFILYRLPGQNEIAYHELDKDLNVFPKFIFHSFDGKDKHVFGLKNSKNLYQSELKDLKLKVPLENIPDDIIEWSKETYLTKCKEFIEALKSDAYDKIILSRIKLLPPMVNPISKFTQLCQKYPTAFVYLTHFSGETWIGASPERLARVKGNKIHTVALAGTKAISDNRNWTQKEFEEHQIVVDYIVENLKDLSPVAQPTSTIQLGEIEHLETKISAQLNDYMSIEKVAQMLHPTPAICGMPKEKSQQFILEHEGYNRGLYTGYFGLIDESYSEIFVNLRCAQLYLDKTAVYVGGGLLAESNPKSEWQETEWKAKALF